MLLQCFAERVDGPLLFASPLASFFLRVAAALNEDQSALQMGMWVSGEHGGIAARSILQPPLLPAKPCSSSAVSM